MSDPYLTGLEHTFTERRAVLERQMKIGGGGSCGAFVRPPPQDGLSTRPRTGTDFHET